MAWVAFDRAVKTVEQFGLDGPGRALARSCARRSTARSASAASTPERGTFTQSYGSRGARRRAAADPAGRLPAARRPARGRDGRGDRARALRDGFVLRYDTARRRRRPAARRGRVPALHLLARRLPRADRAHATRRSALFDRLPGCATTSACSPRSTTRARGRLLGNFPQAFSHVGLVNTAMNLDRATTAPAGRRARRRGDARR